MHSGQHRYGSSAKDAGLSKGFDFASVASGENDKIETQKKEARHDEYGESLDDFMRVAHAVDESVEQREVQPIAAEVGEAIAQRA